MNTIITSSDQASKIKRYWSERAEEADPASAQATTYDVDLRELEISKLNEKITATDLPLALLFRHRELHATTEQFQSLACRYGAS